MTLLPGQREVIDGLLADAIASTTLTSEQINEAVRLLDALAGSGAEWVQDYERNLLRMGMSKELAEYRRRHRKPTTTSRGAVVDAPEYGGVRRPDASGQEEYHQLAFANMTAEELRGWIVDRRKNRDTVSREIQWAEDVLSIMVKKGYLTAAKAIAELERGHA